MSADIACPDHTTIEGYARGTAQKAERSAMEGHLTECRTCLDRVLSLATKYTGHDIPDCHVVKELGRGRFGVVYMAWWVAGKPKLVALKILSNPGQMEQTRFEREISVLKRLDTPGIVKCLHSGTANEAHYFIMDFVEGVHFDDYLGQAELNLDGRLLAFQRICRAVAEAHELGVVHRDLKPRNILVDADGQPHILDFGICSLQEEDWSSAARGTITLPGDVIGTLKYMSPEQAWGGVAGAIDSRSDIWSLGVMLYQIVTEGDYPYSLRATPDKPVHEALLERIRKELPKRPRIAAAPRASALETLVERCLTWEPRHRIASTADLADDVERYRLGQPIATRPLGVAYRLHRVAVGAATRSRMMFALTFLAISAVTLSIAPVALRVAWRVNTGAYHVGQPPVTQVRDGIVVVGVDDATLSAVRVYAESNHIPGVSEDIRSWRAVHGKLMRRMVDARPVAVVWDYFFTSAQPGDTALVEGVRALEESGVPVILAANSYADDGSPQLSPNILGALGRGLRHGGIDARDMVRRPGEFVLAWTSPSGRVLPSLSLTTLAAVLHPEARVDVGWADRRMPLELNYEVDAGRYLRRRDQVRLTKAISGDSEQDRTNGILLACATLPLAPPEQWRRQTTPYEVLLQASEDELRNAVGGRIVIFGDLRPMRPGFQADRHAVKYGARTVPDVPGVYLQADVVAGLLERKTLRSAFPIAPRTLMGFLLLGLIGGAVPIRLARVRVFRRAAAKRMLWVGLSVTAVACAIVMTASVDYAAVHIAMGLLALLIPLAGSFWVEFARNRHRTLDSHRRALVTLGPAMEGTLTLAPPRPKPPRATR